ncbi:hypothetical protein MUK42_03751, partial [Musa troglodytarum]
SFCGKNSISKVTFGFGGLRRRLSNLRLGHGRRCSSVTGKLRQRSDLSRGARTSSKLKFNIPKRFHNHWKASSNMNRTKCTFYKSEEFNIQKQADLPHNPVLEGQPIAPAASSIALGRRSPFDVGKWLGAHLARPANCFGDGAKDCIFAPYFPPEDPHKFAIVHKELPVHQRADAVSSLVYEANARKRDPVYGSVGIISYLQNQISQLQMQLAFAEAELLCIQMQQERALANQHVIDIHEPSSLFCATASQAFLNPST